jgi:hypothetical protein
VSATQIKKVNSWHKLLVDYRLANPAATGRLCAAFFKKSESWISIITNSDAFIEYEASRRGLFEGRLDLTVVEKIEGVANLALDVMEERIQKEREDIGLGVVQDALDSSLRAMGFMDKIDSRGDGDTLIQNNNTTINVATSPQLEKARQMLLAANQTMGPVIEGESVAAERLMSTAQAVQSSGVS